MDAESSEDVSYTKKRKNYLGKFMKKKLLLIDGYSVLFRAYHGMPDLTDKSGTHVGAIYGFLTMLIRILKMKNQTP